MSQDMSVICDIQGDAAHESQCRRTFTLLLTSLCILERDVETAGHEWRKKGLEMLNSKLVLLRYRRIRAPLRPHFQTAVELLNIPPPKKKILHENTFVRLAILGGNKSNFGPPCNM
jgi:hypothetical protein